MKKNKYPICTNLGAGRYCFAGYRDGRISDKKTVIKKTAIKRQFLGLGERGTQFNADVRSTCHHLVQEGFRIRIRIDEYSLKLQDLDPGVKITQKSKKYCKKSEMLLSSTFYFIFTCVILNPSCGYGSQNISAMLDSDPRIMSTDPRTWVHDDSPLAPRVRISSSSLYVWKLRAMAFSSSF